MSESANTLKSQAWTLADQIAFECALAQDEREDWSVLKARDRAISEALPAEDLAPLNRRAIARFWLGERLRQSPSIKLAADCVSQAIETSGQLLCVVGSLFGLGSAFAALAYTGSAPINVSAFFGVFILLQAILAAALFVPFLLPRAVQERLLNSPLARFAKAIFSQALRLTQTLANRFLEAQRRADAAEIAGIVCSRLALHGGLFKWLAFGKMQATALCFNVGALAALLIAVAFSDRAFGWQTTLEVSGESVHALARFFATPWSWFYGEGQGYPTLVDVEGSRIVLKEGIQSLSTENLSAWWRFLALGIVAYGVLPRLLFSVLAGFQLRRGLQRYDFGNATAQSVFDRLAPGLSRFDVQRSDSSSDERPAGALETPNARASSRQTVRCLLEQGLAESLELEALTAELARLWNLPPGNVEAVAYENGSIASAVAEQDPERQYALIVESWMPPIKETERQIETLRRAIDARSLIRIVPLGLPAIDSNRPSLVPAAVYRNTWDSFARKLGDPYLILENFS